MMGAEAPETCWATHKRQVINTWNCCIWLVNLFELYDDAWTCQCQIYVTSVTQNVELTWQTEWEDFWHVVPDNSMLVAHKACLFNCIYMAEHWAASSWQSKVLSRATWVIMKWNYQKSNSKFLILKREINY